jgi:hypothetical protein
MRVINTPIPPGSHELAVWVDLPPSETDTGEPIDIVCNLIRVSDTECEVTKAKGNLSDDVNVAIGLMAARMGYTVMRFAVAAGGTSSRWAKYEYTRYGMDYYRVDLNEAIRLYEKRGTQ